MTQHIVCLAGTSDLFSPSPRDGEPVLLVPFDVPGHPDAFQSSWPDVLAAHGLVPTTAAEDLLRGAIGAYTADMRVARRESYDGWTRDFALYLPVRELEGWASASPVLERLLAFLTGDRWQVLIRQAPEGYRPAHGATPRGLMAVETDTVSLFSGGLDSYVGALDALAEREQAVLLGHHAAGQGPTSAAQRQALAALRRTYPADRSPFLGCWLSPPKGGSRASETTTRGRSILFLALGIAAASALGDARLLVPENGFISLNVPLTPPRSGSLSTRTTHPHLIGLMDRTLSALGITVRLEMPYRFRTKGEMLQGCADPTALAEALPMTMSCAHPGAGRFTKGASANQHCGYCVPCLIRRAAIVASGWPDTTSYRWERLSDSLSTAKSSDVRALKLALDRYEHRTASMANVLTSGPLPGTADERAAYLDVFRRGLGELGRFVDAA